MKLKIKITQDILGRSMMCGAMVGKPNGENCAIALAVRDIFPVAHVGINHIWIDGADSKRLIPLPESATRFIFQFDLLKTNVTQRLKLPEFEFEIEVPEQIIEQIGIQEALDIIENSNTLELVK